MPNLSPETALVEPGLKQTAVEKKEDRFPGIPLDRSVIEKLKGSLQEKAYQEGHLITGQLKADPRDPTHYLFIERGSQQEHMPNGIYAFIIHKTVHGFELYLGQGSHYFIAKKSPAVIAAGDIYFTQGFITKITDQSGSYHLPPNDPAYELKRRQALVAMQACGLPMRQFQSFQETTTQALLFSRPKSLSLTPLAQNNLSRKPISFEV